MISVNCPSGGCIKAMCSPQDVNNDRSLKRALITEPKNAIESVQMLTWLNQFSALKRFISEAIKTLGFPQWNASKGSKESHRSYTGLKSQKFSVVNSFPFQVTSRRSVRIFWMITTCDSLFIPLQIHSHFKVFPSLNVFKQPYRNVLSVRKN